MEGIGEVVEVNVVGTGVVVEADVVAVGVVVEADVVGVGVVEEEESTLIVVGCGFGGAVVVVDDENGASRLSSYHSSLEYSGKS